MIRSRKVLVDQVPPPLSLTSPSRSLRLRQYQGGRRRRWPPRGLGLCALSTARNPKIRELQPHRGGQSAQHLQPQLRASDAEAYKLHHQQRQQQPPLLSSKPQGSQRSQKQSLQTPFPIPAATEPTQQQQQPSEQPPQQQKSPAAAGNLAASSDRASTGCSRR